MINRMKAAILAGVLTVSAVTTATLAGPVSLEVQAETTYQVAPTKETTQLAVTAGQNAQTAAADMDITAAVTQLTDADTADLVATIAALITEGDTTMIANYTGDSLNITSMAGGVESLSSYQVTFAAGDAAALEKAGQALVVIPLREVMHGRTLRAGEAVQGFLYNNADGVFYATETMIVGDQVCYYAPYFPANTDNRIVFYVSRGEWTATDSTYDYLAIGNSITLHPRRDFWPDAMGMGASAVSKDYVHIVQRGLTRFQANVNAAALNYSIWEIMPANRTSTLSLLDDFLSADLELVTIMLGENVITYRGDFATDYPALIQYVKSKAPNALIVLIGTFWQDDEIEAVKMATAAQYNCLYVSLADIQNDAKYRFGSGYAADADGELHYSDNPGTSIHPNDAAMSYIANGVLSTVSAAYTSAAEAAAADAAATEAVADVPDASADIDPEFSVSPDEIVEDTEGE